MTEKNSKFVILFDDNPCAATDAKITIKASRLNIAMEYEDGTISQRAIFSIANGCIYLNKKDYPRLRIVESN